jgi:hypothetical protein
VSKEKDLDIDPRLTTGWASDMFEELLNRTRRLQELLHVSTRGIAVLQDMPAIMDILAKGKDDEFKSESTHNERIANEAALAKREVLEGYPLLHAFTAIALWSALESTIRLFVARWLRNNASALTSDAFSKIRVRVAEYEQLQGEDRYLFLVDRLEQELSSPLKTGAARFESLLESIGLAGHVDEDDAKTLHELCQVRNVILHRYGVADRRFVEACPWLSYKVGDPVHISARMIENYLLGVQSYLVRLVTRVGEKFGRDMSEFNERLRAMKAQKG